MGSRLKDQAKPFSAKWISARLREKVNNDRELDGLIVAFSFDEPAEELETTIKEAGSYGRDLALRAATELDRCSEEECRLEDAIRPFTLAYKSNTDPGKVRQSDDVSHQVNLCDLRQAFELLTRNNTEMDWLDRVLLVKKLRKEGGRPRFGGGRGVHIFTSAADAIERIETYNQVLRDGLMPFALAYKAEEPRQMVKPHHVSGAASALKKVKGKEIIPFRF